MPPAGTSSPSARRTTTSSSKLRNINESSMREGMSGEAPCDLRATAGDFDMYYACTSSGAASCVCETKLQCQQFSFAGLLFVNQAIAHSLRFGSLGRTCARLGHCECQQRAVKYTEMCRNQTRLARVRVELDGDRAVIHKADTHHRPKHPVVYVLGCILRPHLGQKPLVCVSVSALSAFSTRSLTYRSPWQRRRPWLCGSRAWRLSWCWHRA